MAAEARSRADWLVGINASQALSIAADNGVYSLEEYRPLPLFLICKRYLENTSFKIQYYWQIQLSHNKMGVDFKSISVTKMGRRKTAADVLRNIERNGKATVIATETKIVTEQLPLLFDLTGLQKKQIKLNLSAEETLK